MGTNDLAKETARRCPAAAGMIPGSRLFAADGPMASTSSTACSTRSATAGLEAELSQGRLLGMDGKTLIHPSQIEPCNAAFSPRPEEVEWARKIIAAFDLKENAGKGVISLDGRMVELLHAQIAKRTVAIADMIAEREAAN